MMIVFVDSTHKNATMLMAVYNGVHLGKVVDCIRECDSAQLSKVVEDAGGVFQQTVAGRKMEETQISEA